MWEWNRQKSATNKKHLSALLFGGSGLLESVDDGGRVRGHGLLRRTFNVREQDGLGGRSEGLACRGGSRRTGHDPGDVGAVAAADGCVGIGGGGDLEDMPSQPESEETARRCREVLAPSR